MCLILNIDTTSTIASVSIAKNAAILFEEINADQKNHAAFLHTSIEKIISQAAVRFKDLDAISVNNGPGSYTGIRVGLASAKGLCYALNKPLILLNALELLTMSAIEEYPESSLQNLLFCPMIDARRMEIFTAIYKADLEIILTPCSHIISEESFSSFLSTNNVAFFGDGSSKFQQINNNPNARFIPVKMKTEIMSILSFKKFKNDDFSDISYVEPIYIKDFFTTQNPINQ